MKHLLTLAAIFSIAVFVFCSCRKEAPTREKQTFGPVASAGADQHHLTPVDTIILNGKGMDVDGFVVSYQWRKLNDPSQLEILSPNTAITIIKNLPLGLHSFELTIIDNDGFIGRDVMNVLVGVDQGCSECGAWDY